MKLVGTLNGSKIYSDPRIEDGIIYILNEETYPGLTEALEEQATLEGIFEIDTKGKKAYNLGS